VTASDNYNISASDKFTEIIQAAEQLGGAALSHIVEVTCFDGLKPVITPSDGKPVAGIAFPVTIDPGDLAGLTHAMSEAAEGCIICIAPSAMEKRAMVGGLSVLEAKRAGIRAIVLDGYVCDLQELRSAGVPVAAKGVVPVAASLGSLMGHYELGAQFNDFSIEKGDLIVLDGDGVVSLGKKPELENLPRLAVELLAREEQIKTELKEGRTLWDIVLQMKRKLAMQKLGGFKR